MEFKEKAAQLSYELEEFRDCAKVKFVDVDQTGIDNYPAVEQIVKMGYPYPITVINGAPRFAGGLNSAQIKEAIKAIIN
ncbi:MAG: hypothetical protein ACOX0E_00425 [Syntrophomonadaceae bacterium]|jgi:hypothetical protein